MPRQRKRRMVCCLPDNNHFGPLDCTIKGPDGTIHLTVDEYETVRLIDLESLTQEECAKQMNIARTTVQGIYNSARTKIADALVNAKAIKIEGGDYRLCERYGVSCENCECGVKKCYNRRQEK